MVTIEHRVRSIDPLTVSITALMMLFACVICTWMINSSYDQLYNYNRLYILIATTYIFIYIGGSIQSSPKDRRSTIIVLSTAATIALFVMSQVLLRHMAPISPTPIGMAAIDLSTEITQLNSAELAALAALEVPEGIKFIMDGGIDRWVFIAYELGINFTEYSKIPIQEKGIFYLYVSAMEIFGSYNAFHMLVANWAIVIAASGLVYAISRLFVEDMPSLVCSTMVLLLPENLYFSGVLSKDIWTSAVFLLFFYCIVAESSKQKRFVLYGVAATAVLCMAFIRSGVVLPMLVTGGVIVFSASRSRLQDMSIYIAAITTVVATAMIMLPGDIIQDIGNKTVYRTLDKFLYGSAKHLDNQNISYTTTPEESVLNRFGGGDISIENLYVIPIRVASYLLAPFPPLSIRFVGDYYIIPSTYLIAILSVSFMMGLAALLRRWREPAVALIVAFLMLGITLSFSGPFVYERYRILLTPFYFMISVPIFVSAKPSQRLLMVILSAGLWLAAVAVFFLIR